MMNKLKYIKCCIRKATEYCLSYIWNFFIYILKAYLLMIITCVVIYGDVLVLFYMVNYIRTVGELLNAMSWVIGIGAIFIPLLNIQVLIVLFFYRFNKLEIICETCVVMLLIRLEIINEKFTSLWPIFLSILLYIVLKKIMVKLYLRHKYR